MTRPSPSDARLGSLLVALQFVLLGWLAVEGVRGLAAGRLPIDAIGLAAAGFALGAWALSANRPGNFNVRPLPRAGGELVQRGPYRWIRHPMYSALLLAGVAAARLADDALAWLLLLALAAVLVAKARVEERGMRAQHAGYLDYQQRTRGFVPWLF